MTCLFFQTMHNSNFHKSNFFIFIPKQRNIHFLIYNTQKKNRTVQTNKQKNGPIRTKT